MKKIRKRFFIFIFPVVALAVVLTSFIGNLYKNGLQEEVYVDLNENMTHRKVYVLSSDNTLVPLTVSFKSKEYISQDILEVLSLLRKGSIVESKGYKPLLQKDVAINNIEIKDKILNIDFSTQFYDYNPLEETKIVQGLTWSLLQYDEVDGITISVDGIKLEKLPVSGIILPSILNRDIGINNYDDTSGNIYNTTSVTVFYQKLIDGKAVYVPVTRRVNSASNIHETIFKTMSLNTSILSGYQTIPILNYLDQEKQVSFSTQEIEIDLTVNSLVEEGVIKSEIYEILRLTYEELNGLEVSFNFLVNNEEVAVNGYLDPNETSVSNILINEIKI